MADKEKTFQELYCEEHSLPPEKFEHAILHRTLHLNAILCYPLIMTACPYFLTTDREFIRKIGACRSLNEAKTVYSEFSSNPYNDSFFRRVLQIRISKRHALDIAAHTFPPQPPEPMSLPRRVQMPNAEDPD